MRTVVYNVCGFETTSFEIKNQLEDKLNTKAKTILREVDNGSFKRSPIREAMIEKFGYVSKKFRDKVEVS